MNKLKQKIYKELDNKGFVNLKFLFSDEVLDISLEILRELLEEEKIKFKKLLNTKKEEIKFDIFNQPEILGYFWSLLNHLNNVSKGDKIKSIIDNFEPEYIDFVNDVSFNRDFYDMYVYCLKNCDLDIEQTKIISEIVKSFKLKGINLEEGKQNKIKEINKKLTKLSNDFSNNIVDDESLFEYIILDFDKIKDLPESSIKVAKALADNKKIDGYLFNADPTLYGDIMKYCSDKKIRSDFYYTFANFASKDKFDNRQNILDILTLKNKKASILGYKNFALYNMEKKMADTPEQVVELITGISQKARVKAIKEIEELKNYFNLDEIGPSDFAYYTRIYKEEKYSIDDKEIKKYFEFENVLLYLHDLVNKLYGIELKEIKLESYDKEIRIYEVYKDSKLISYYFLDAFYREHKRPGAWADNLREKDYIIGNKQIPIILNVCNFQKSQSGLTLLTFGDVETIFHEFGHALHEILSKSKYSELSGFGVEWDFVELPSQIHENWVNERESLKKLSKHYETGKAMSSDLLDKLDSLNTFMSGNFVLRQNELALLDMYLYTTTIPDNIEELDKMVLEKINELGLFKRSDNYKMYTSFGHIFGGGYAAGYYSYMWAEIIEADVFAKIKKDGMFKRETGLHFLNTILGMGCIKDAKDLFFDYMGREVNDKAFLERKGL